jgi:hypothetical protein
MPAISIIMARYSLKRKDGSIVDGLSWNKKSHAESWIRHHAKLYGGMMWRVGGLFKCRNNEELEIVWSKSHKTVNWYCVDPAQITEYDPAMHYKSITAP